MDLNVIFISPLSELLKDLVNHLPQAEGFTVYELDSIDEYRQVVDFLPKSVTLTSNLKVTQSYLKLVKEVQSASSHNILVSEREIPLMLDVKLCSDGLNLVLSENACDIDIIKKIIIDYFEDNLSVDENLLSRNNLGKKNKDEKKTMRLERGILSSKKGQFDFSKKKPFSLRNDKRRLEPKKLKRNYNEASFYEAKDVTPKEMQELYLYNLKKIKLNKDITEVEKKEKYELLVNTYLDDFDPPEYTKEILKSSPQRLEDLLEENFDRYLGYSNNLEFLVFISEFYKYKEIHNESITKFIHLSLNNLVESETSFFTYDHVNESIEVVHSYHSDRYFDDEDSLGKLIEELPPIINQIKVDHFYDHDLLSNINYYIFPYFRGDEVLGFSLTHFKSSLLSREAKRQLELFTSLARGIFL